MKIKNNAAFTLIELLVVIGIIAVLAALLMPALSGASNKGKDAKCLSNLRQWGVALNCFLSDNSGALPSEGTQENPTWAQTMAVEDQNAWYNVLPPYVEQTALKDLTATQRNQFYLPGKVGILQCPRAIWLGSERLMSGPRFSYAFNSKVLGGLGEKPMVFQLAPNGGVNVNNRTVGASTIPILLDARASTKEPKAVSGMNNDVGTAKAYTRRLSNRHANAYNRGGTANIVFFDGSVRSFTTSEVMDNNGRNIASSPVIWNPSDPDAAD